MIYKEKALREIQQLEFNKDVNLPDVETITISQLDPNTTYVVKVEIEKVDDVDIICRNLKQMLKEVGITKVLIIPTFYGKSAIDFSELEPSNVELEPTIE